jgi:hypothetical protein
MLNPRSAHQTCLVLPFAFPAVTNQRHCSADRCLCFRSRFFVAIDGLLSPLRLQLRIASLMAGYKVRLL